MRKNDQKFTDNLWKTTVNHKIFSPHPKNKEIQNSMATNPEKHVIISLDYTSTRCDKVAHEILKILKTVSPEYSCRICWKLITVDSILLPRLKRKIETKNVTHLVYRFQCPDNCQNGIYIGESKRRLCDRTREHYRSGPIHDHINSCDKYHKGLIDKYGTPTDQNKKEFFQDCFTIVQRNLVNYNKRTTIEAIFVSLHKPVLNEQVKFKSLTII